MVTALRAAGGVAPLEIAPALQVAARAGVKAYAEAPVGSLTAKQEAPWLIVLLMLEGTGCR